MLLGQAEPLKKENRTHLAPKSDRSDTQQSHRSNNETNNISELLNTKVNDFFATEMKKIRRKMRLPSAKESNDVSEMVKQNAFIFRDIDKFARKQNSLMDLHLGRTQTPKYTMNEKNKYLHDENNRLTILLKSKNLRNKDFKRKYSTLRA